MTTDTNSKTKFLSVPQKTLDEICEITNRWHQQVNQLKTIHQKLDKWITQEKELIHKLDCTEEDMHELLQKVDGYDADTSGPTATPEKEKTDE